MKAFESVTEPPPVVSLTSCSPTDPDGVTTVIEVALTLVSDVPAIPSNVTPVVPANLMPVIVTVVPPVVGPLAGETDVIVGVPLMVSFEPSLTNAVLLGSDVFTLKVADA